MAEAGRNPALASNLRNAPQTRNLFAAPPLQIITSPASAVAPTNRENKMKTTKITLSLSTASSAKLHLAAAALVLALLAIPHLGHAQGIVRGAQEGAYEGNRAAGPVGGLVGGAVGAGVGGAMGAMHGVLGIPDRGYRRGYRCRGFYDRHDRFHCYR